MALDTSAITGAPVDPNVVSSIVQVDRRGVRRLRVRTAGSRCFGKGKPEPAGGASSYATPCEPEKRQERSR
jgi:hypothetical protein